MPELPEVETVARLIRPRLLGRRILEGTVHWERTLGGMDAETFERAIVGATIVKVWRRAKFVVLDLQRRGRPSGHVIGHLRMTGRMQVERDGVDPGRYVKVSLRLDRGDVFHFIDVRKFGRLSYARDAEEVLGGLGPEPLADGFTSAWLYKALHARRRVLKPLLLDQRFVAGLGNIYVDESLFAAGLHPLARSDRVSRVRASRLCAAIRATLRAAIRREGSSFDVFYRTPEGRPGGYQDEFKVYGRENEPCFTCGTKIAKFWLGQRGTHFCRRCQRR